MNLFNIAHSFVHSNNLNHWRLTIQFNISHLFVLNEMVKQFYLTHK